ncbi:hypothetical protein BH23CHL8_BH23CHL8_10590 [soil metagenome]
MVTPAGHSATDGLADTSVFIASKTGRPILAEIPGLEMIRV